MDELVRLNGLLKGKLVTRVYGADGTFQCKRRTDERTPGSLDIPIGDYDSDTFGEIAIEFSDGSYITVWSSEWGGIVYRQSEE